MKKRCHYCGADALTRDHVVPRSLLSELSADDLASGPRNVVPACEKCNQKKGSKRSNCRCQVCAVAWRVLGPVGWQTIPVVSLLLADGGWL